MAHNDFKRYVWLIDLLNNVDGASFQDINDAWQDEPELNPEGAELPVRTFYNHLAAIKSVFDIVIERSKSDGKYHILINDDIYSSRMQKVMMSMLSMNNVVERYINLRGRILYEEEPFTYPEWMRQILHAMNYGKKIRLEYRKYGDSRSSSRVLSPYCLKMFRRRWYLLAQDGKSLKTFALDDRTMNVNELDKAFDYPEDFSADAFFQDSFGIWKASPKRVVIKAFGQEVDYLRSTPIHSSQKELESTEEYTLFSLNVGVDAWEFIQEILSHGDRIEVLEPLSLRQAIASKINDMRGLYAEFWQ